MSSSDNQSVAQPHLKKQDLATLDITKLTPLSPEVISRQATINIGTIGHVAHGKSTVVKAISGVQTVRFKNELERNITIKLERLTQLEIQDITKSKESVRNFVLHLNKEYQNSPYLKRQLRTRRSSLGTETAPDISRKRRRNSVETDSNTSFSSNSSYRKGTKKLKLNPNNEYEVEKVLTIEFSEGHPLYKVKWLGWPDKFNTWETFQNLRNTVALGEFLDSEIEKWGQAEIQALEDEFTESCEIKVTNKEEFQGLLREARQYDEDLLKSNLIILAQYRHLERGKYPKSMVRRTKKMLRWKRIAEMRNAQVARMNSWVENVNEIERASNIFVENENDFETPPENFTYVNKNVAGEGVRITSEPATSCDCSDGCSYFSVNCCAKQKGFRFAYNSKSELRLRVGFPIYECNSSCSCGPDCLNRVIERGRTNNLVIFKTPDRGWGVYAKKAIPEGQFVCEYTGELITNEEAERRGKKYDSAGRTYLFDLDFNSADNLYTVDALAFGNIARFINHSCEPNCDIYASWGDNGDPYMHNIVFFSNRRIAAGEELSIDYLNGSREINAEAEEIVAKEMGSRENADPNCQTVASPKKTPNKKGFRQTPSKVQESDVVRNLSVKFGGFGDGDLSSDEDTVLSKCECKCGSKKCRKWIWG